MRYVSIALYQRHDTSLVAGAVTDDYGSFILTTSHEGAYILRVSFVGYKTQDYMIIPGHDRTLWHDTIYLSRTTQYLEALTVTTNQTDKNISFDMTTFRIGQSQGGVTGSLLDVLKNQPSITIDSEQKLYIRGNANILLLIDGLPASADMLNSISASSAETIEIITNPNVKYDAEGTSGIINIVMKSESRHRITGSATVNFGLLRKVNGGVNLAIRGKKINFSLYYNGRVEHDEISSHLYRSLKPYVLDVTQEAESFQHTNIQTAGIVLNTKLSGNTTLKGGVRVLFPNLHNAQHLSIRQVRDTLPESFSNRINEVTFLRKNIEGTLSWRRMYKPGKHELSFDGLFARTRGSRPAEYFSEELLIARSEGGGTPTMTSIQTDYLLILTGNTLLEAGLKGFMRWNTFNYEFFDWDATSGWVPNLMFSNDLVHREEILSGYMMISDTLFRRAFVKGGLRMEHNYSELIQRTLLDTIRSNKWYPFPFLSIRYNLTPVHRFGFTLNRRITRPTYPQLNPWINMIDQFTYETGNKNLNPEVLDKVEMGYHFVKERFKVSSNLFVSSTQNFITQVTFITPPDKIMATYVNGDREWKTGIELDGRVEASRILTVNGAITAYHATTSGTVQGVEMNTADFAYNGNLSFIIKPTKKTSIQVTANYHSPITLPQFDLEQILYADLSVRHSIMNSRLQLNLTITDLFNSRKWSISSDNALYLLENRSHSITRMVWVGLTYNLNNYKPSPSRMQQEPETDRSMIRMGQ
jgi:hypothetical protein